MNTLAKPCLASFFSLSNFLSPESILYANANCILSRSVNSFGSTPIYLAF
nr:MAG TPA: hypothetical protein [Caudoviricetes sp.]